jgi:cytochrome P450
MTNETQMPVVLTGVDGLRVFARFLRDPMLAMRSTYDIHGPFVIVDSPLRIFFGARHRLFAFTAAPRLNREVLSDPETWRPVHIMFVSRKDSASRRVGLGIFSMGGARHSHYRDLLSQPLRKSNVDSRGPEMAQLAEQFVDQWPVGKSFDLWRQGRRLIRDLSIGLLFGDDRERAYPIADLVDERVLFKWSLGALACPVNLPLTPYGRMNRQSVAIEKGITAWAGCKRGQLDNRDLLSILVNNPDENGNPLTDATFAGHVPSLFVAGYETCQTSLTWTLVLLAQHPRIAQDLADELGKLDGAPLTLEAVKDLPLLDAVIKESMRLLPPVPMQGRTATHATQLGGYQVPARTRVVLSAFVINRLPDLYPDPDRFKPERWASIRPSAFEYASFSGGPRICPGQWFGLDLLKVSLAAILRRFRVELQPNLRIEYQIQPTLSPRTPVPAMLKSKRDTFASTRLRGGISRLIQFPG